ncbi:MAG TPA: hypothetical protein VHG08_02370 [Longimicrobium sp.]|nr:hypothetical protein [Longimicrobium sp.]
MHTSSPGERGVWIRRENRIVLLPGGAAGAPVAAGLETELESAPPDYTVCDFIHPNIDVAAQYALFGMLREGGVARSVALMILAAVKAKPPLLGGVYQVDQYVPAMRARFWNKGWWQLIPAGRPSACLPATARGEPPLIVFRKSLAKDPAALGRALLSAWTECSFSVPVPAPPGPGGRPCTRPKPAGRAAMIVAPATLVFDRQSTVAGVIVGRIMVSSSGPGSVTWQARPTASWVRLIPSSGTATAAGTEVSVIVDASQLQRGARHITNVLITSPGARTADLDVEVR